MASRDSPWRRGNRQSFLPGTVRIGSSRLLRDAFLLRRAQAAGSQPQGNTMNERPRQGYDQSFAPVKARTAWSGHLPESAIFLC